MATKQIRLNLPIGMFKKIIKITRDESIYEDHCDLILHAVMDLLEDYK